MNYQELKDFIATKMRMSFNT